MVLYASLHFRVHVFCEEGQTEKIGQFPGTHFDRGDPLSTNQFEITGVGCAQM